MSSERGRGSLLKKEKKAPIKGNSVLAQESELDSDHNGVGRESRKIRLAIVDDHAMFRYALRTMLEKELGIQVVGEAGDGLELLKLACKVPIDVVTMDIGMPHMNGIEATRRLIAINPEVKVIALTAFTDRDFALDMLKAGASGYVTKVELADVLLQAFRAVLKNRIFLCPEIAQTLSSALLTGANVRDSDIQSESLLAREREILKLIVEGCGSAEIAKRLGLALSTIEVHRRNIMRKLDLHSVSELIAYADRTGI